MSVAAEGKGARGAIAPPPPTSSKQTKKLPVSSYVISLKYEMIYNTQSELDCQLGYFPLRPTLLETSGGGLSYVHYQEIEILQ